MTSPDTGWWTDHGPESLHFHSAGFQVLDRAEGPRLPAESRPVDRGAGQACVPGTGGGTPAWKRALQDGALWGGEGAEAGLLRGASVCWGPSAPLPGRPPLREEGGGGEGSGAPALSLSLRSHYGQRVWGTPVTVLPSLVPTVFSSAHCLLRVCLVLGSVPAVLKDDSGGAQGPYEVTGLEPVSSGCKAGAPLPTALFTGALEEPWDQATSPSPPRLSELGSGQ